MKHFAEVLNSIEIDIALEYRRIKILVEETYYYDSYYRDAHCGIDTLIEDNFDFLPKELTCGAINFEDFYDNFVENFGHDYRIIDNSNDINLLVSYCEFYYNLVTCIYPRLMENRILAHSKIRNFIGHIEYLCSRINYEIKSLDSFYYIVPHSAEVTLACENLPDELVGDVFTYHHYSFEGDVKHKQDVLSKLCKYIEPRRKELEKADDELEDLLFFFCNNYFVRHNNENNQSRVNKLSETELIGYYDKIYSLFIEACLRLDNKSYRDEISILKSK